MERIASGEPLRAETQADVLTQPATTVAETIKRIRIVRHQWNKALDYITDLDFVVQNTFGRWSVRDVIAHFIGWERILIERLGHVKNNNADGVAVFTDEGVDEVNTQWVTRFKDSDRSEVMDEWNAAQSDLQHIIQSLTDSMLASQAGGRTVSEIIAGSSFAHEYEHLQKVQSWLQTFQTASTSTVGVPRVRSDVKPSSSIPNPPFWGDRVVEDISLTDIFPFINEVALFRGQWQFTRGKMSGSAYQSFVDAKVRPVFDAWKKRALEEKLLIPKVVYGYFPCQSDWNDLVIYENDHTTEKLRFTFPRQSDNHHYCISDFFAPKESGKMDVIGCMLVTVGQQASDFSAQLFESDNYADYLYFHGLSVETAEALAEYWHRQMRLELGIASGDHSDTKKLFQQSYQGSRYSFGYPACPHLEDQSKLFTLLDPKRIGITLTDEYHLVPEQSTSAIIVHHPEAKYFNI
ncbi:MAG TPA: vitamin B12 dependent-methionine synthase activation domain-containing protein [bacterium]|nr:vitamin B12 dependent-methionine synthase activation domain-containing protein [bacterium]